MVISIKETSLLVLNQARETIKNNHLLSFISLKTASVGASGLGHCLKHHFASSLLIQLPANAPRESKRVWLKYLDPYFTNVRPGWNFLILGSDLAQPQSLWVCGA